MPVIVPSSPKAIRIGLAGVAALGALLVGCAGPGPGGGDPASTSAVPLAQAREAEGVTAFERGEYERARPLLEREARRGNPLAARYLGRIHLEAIGVERDRRAAGAAFHRGAVLGDAVSQVRLAKLHYDGLDFETGHRKARYWFRQAAEQGNAEAQYALYNMLLQGLGGEIRGAAAMAWAWLASENGHAGGEQAWGNRAMLMPEQAARDIRAAHGPGQWPQYPEFDEDQADKLRRAPADGDGEPVRPIRLQLRLADDEAIRVVGVREMDDVIPVDGVNLPWISYNVVDITTVIEEVAPRLEGEASLIEARVMTEVARRGGEKLRVRTRAFRRKQD